MILHGWFAWMLLGYAIGIIFTGIIMVAVVGSLYSAKILYRVQGDMVIREGYIRDETDALIKIGSRIKAQNLRRIREGGPPLPDDSQWYEKDKIELIRVLNKRKVVGQSAEEKQPKREKLEVELPFKPILLKSVRDILAGVSIMGVGFALFYVSMYTLETRKSLTGFEGFIPMLLFLIGSLWGFYFVLRGGFRISNRLGKGA
jgi:hypothetical protein